MNGRHIVPIYIYKIDDCHSIVKVFITKLLILIPILDLLLLTII